MKDWQCEKCGSKSYRKSGDIISCLQCNITLDIRVDITKLSPTDVEMHAKSKISEHKVKRAGFEKYVDELNYMIERAPTEERQKHLRQVRDNQALYYYNKYK